MYKFLNCATSNTLYEKDIHAYIQKGNNLIGKYPQLHINKNVHSYIYILKKHICITYPTTFSSYRVLQKSRLLIGLQKWPPSLTPARVGLYEFRPEFLVVLLLLFFFYCRSPSYSSSFQLVACIFDVHSATIEANLEFNQAPHKNTFLHSKATAGARARSIECIFYIGLGKSRQTQIFLLITMNKTNISIPIKHIFFYN